MKTKKRKKIKNNMPKRGFSPVLLIVIIIILVASFIYYKYHKKIYPTLPTIKKEKIVLNLYFAEPNTERLILEERKVKVYGDLTSRSKQLILELIKGPNTNLTGTIPPGTTLLDLSINPDGIAFVDFSSELTNRHPGGSSAELLTIYSIVNSLTLNFKEIKKVQILEEGKKVDTIAGHILAIMPFEANTEIIGN
ncbi:MAG: GerMN domain-containing protein [Pseudomonadota bacterium]